MIGNVATPTMWEGGAIRQVQSPRIARNAAAQHRTGHQLCKESAFEGLRPRTKAVNCPPHPSRTALLYHKSIGSAQRTSGRSSGVEHNLAKVGVEGSNPFARSSFSKGLPVTLSTSL